MSEELNHVSGSKEERYASLLPQIRSLIEGEPDMIANLANVAAALKEAFDFFWVGFYLVKGEELVLANSVWVYMDMERMRPMRIPEKVADAYRPEIGEELPGEWGARKLSVPEGGTEMPPVPVAGFFIDTNHHMNNGKYILVAKESVSENFAIGGVRAEYRRAAMLGDVLYPVVAVAEEKITVVLTDGGDQIYAIVEFAAAEKN